MKPPPPSHVSPRPREDFVCTADHAIELSMAPFASDNVNKQHSSATPARSGRTFIIQTSITSTSTSTASTRFFQYTSKHQALDQTSRTLARFARRNEPRMSRIPIPTYLQQQQQQSPTPQRTASGDIMSSNSPMSSDTRRKQSKRDEVGFILSYNRSPWKW
jgi:hypothetical protein